MNKISYASRYYNLDTTSLYAQKAYDIAKSCDYSEGMADAILNESFCRMALMDYPAVDSLLIIADSLTNNEITSLIIEVGHMRLCQRKAQNKDFYFHKSAADRLINKVSKDIDNLSQKDKDKYTFAKSEYSIVLSTYLYYVQLYDESSEALLEISRDNNITLINDTAQYLGYLYNIGAGGILRNMSDEETLCSEFDYLMQCYMLAHHSNYLYWEANALQSLAEHIVNPEDLQLIKQKDPACLRYLNDDGIPDSLLAGNLAERSLIGFVSYGDCYQIAGSCRTLAQCYKQIDDHESELSCLLSAMEDTVIFQSPDLVASIYEKLSIAYSAMNDKQMSDYHRNLYLDIQDSTRQDRQLEARIDALTDMLDKTRTLMYSVIALIVVMACVIVVLIRRKKKHDYSSDHKRILQPMEQWIDKQRGILSNEQGEIEEIEEQKMSLSLQSEDALRLNVEQHAKISLVQNMMPLIDRMLHAVGEGKEIKSENLEYVSDICDTIIQYNNSLTKWVQLRKGQISLKVESFPLQALFDVVKLGRTSFTSKGLALNVVDTDIVVKADKTLTLFLINTILDNARKHTQEKGSVTLCANASDLHKDYVDISVTDTGEGMSPQQVEHLFDYKVIDDSEENLKEQKSHGFGLMNCRGIMDRYRKTSEMFSHCSIHAESEQGKGTKILFRLPMSMRVLLLVFTFSLQFLSLGANNDITRYADAVYNANIEGRYEDALLYGDSCIHAFNVDYRKQYGKKATDTLTIEYNEAELSWLKNGVVTDYDALLSVRNEMAVAALALHEWTIYGNNNKAYTNLYKELSKDTTLNTYCETMEQTELQYNVFMVLLFLLVITLVIIFWWFYLREQVYRRRSKMVLSDLFRFLLSDEKQEEETSLSASLKKIDEALLLLSNDNIRLMSNDLQHVTMDVRDKLMHCKTQILELEDKKRILSEDIVRLQRERDRLYVSNSVIDNTLSALKHETMYFPSRISSLVGNILKTEKGDTPNDELRESVGYYRSLYAMLASQCARNEKEVSYSVTSIPLTSLNFDFEEFSDIHILANRQLMDYLALILKRKNGRIMPQASFSMKDQKYVELVVDCPEISISSNDLSNLFTPLTIDVDYLILRQILREIGNNTNSYASGIRASEAGARGVRFVVTIPVASHA